jgi:hypothetical protein
MSEEEVVYNNGIVETVPSEKDNQFSGMLKCDICGKESKGSFGLKIHMKKAHAPKKRVIHPRGLRKAAPIKTEPPVYERDALVSQTLEERATQPWRPVSQLFSTKLQGMRPRWVRKDLLEKRIEEGWQPRLSDTKNRVESPEKTIIDGIPLSKYVMKRGMILCDIPEVLAQSRESYYRRMNDGGLRSQKAELDAGTGGNTYGDIVISRE